MKMLEIIAGVMIWGVLIATVIAFATLYHAVTN